MGTILSVNVSSVKGVEKESQDKAMIVEGWGLEGDAHGGDWDRQVSILPIEAYDKVPDHKRKEVFDGGYTENVTISGIPLDELTVGRFIKLGEAVVEILHIGKEEYKEQGRPYIVSREGRFGRVVRGGLIKAGDEAVVILQP